MMRADEIKTRIQELRSQESELASKVSEAAIAKDSLLASLYTEMKDAAFKRLDLIPQIDKALADLYEKIRGSGVIGAAKLIGSQCGGCNLAINSGDLAKLVALPEEEVARCEECRCILVRK